MNRIPWMALATLMGAAGVARGDRVDDCVRAEMGRQHIPGVSLAYSLAVTSSRRGDNSR